MPGPFHLHLDYSVYTSPATFDGYALVTGSTPVLVDTHLFGIIAENTNSSARWIQLFDGYAQPTNGQVPIVSIKVNGTTLGNNQVTYEPPKPWQNFKKGIVVATSTTGPTYTAGSTDMFLTAFYLTT